MARTALVTGANRGIGFAAARALGQAGLNVVMTARNSERGRQAAGRLAREGLPVRFATLDVGQERSVKACARRLTREGTEIDVLINNAGVYPGAELFDLTTRAFRQALDVNLLGAFWAANAFVPAMVERGYGRVVNMSSGFGSFAQGLGGPPAYAVSKAALGALTVKLAQATPNRVKVNAMDPGWVRTRMGGRDATRAPEEAVDTLVWLATLPARGPDGGFFRDREPIDW